MFAWGTLVPSWAAAWTRFLPRDSPTRAGAWGGVGGYVEAEELQTLSQRERGAAWSQAPRRGFCTHVCQHGELPRAAPSDPLWASQFRQPPLAKSQSAGRTMAQQKENVKAKRTGSMSMQRSVKEHLHVRLSLLRAKLVPPKFPCCSPNRQDLRK